ncbi:MAG: carboxymuconolactone decarboxylase family protein [Parvibaculaceae bacterium]
MQYPDISNLTPELRAILTGKNNANVYKMLMHSPNLAPGFTGMADAVMWSKAWPATWRELAIVRVGQLYNSPYEVHQHEQIGRLMGLSDEKLAACAVDADQSDLSDDERTILRLTDAIVAKHTLTQAERDVAMKLFNANQFADFVMTVGFYQLVSNFLNVFDVQRDDHDLFPAPKPNSERGGKA